MMISGTGLKFERNVTIAIALFLIALVSLPILALIYFSFTGRSDGMTHIMQHVVPRASITTFELLIGVGVLSAVTGTVTAWLVSFFEFPLRRYFVWILVLPLAVPTYIAAYNFVEFFSYTGPAQTLVRFIGGYTSARDYWFPDAQTLSGAIIILAGVLYPYVYLTVLALFRLQAGLYVAAARTLQVPPAVVFARVILPLAWPAIAVGTMLCLMETMNDIGAVEYLGVETLTLSVYSV